MSFINRCGISLSGKTLMKDNGSWSLNEGSEFNRDMDILQVSLDFVIKFCK